jgi:hypothetical protein
MDGTQPQQVWRMQAELAQAHASGALAGLFGRLRGPDVVGEVTSSVPDDVVVTHDGRLLFAYAADEAALAGARRALESVLEREHVDASIRVSHWDDELDRWIQTDPPPDAAELAAESAARREADEIQTRTLVVSSGKLVRGEFEQTMREWAERLALECRIVEHPHLLSTQIAFTVTGPRRRLEEFERGLRVEEWATIRTETHVMVSPL